MFEYAATLGLIDVAYVAPAGVRRDFRSLWGTDDLDFLSRYDGLLYFRLNPLGAYCLGPAEAYMPSAVPTRAVLTVLPSLQINVSEEALAPDEALLLGAYAEQEMDTVWRLNREKALAAVESGNQIAELRAFLQACCGPLSWSWVFSSMVKRLSMYGKEAYQQRSTEGTSGQA